MQLDLPKQRRLQVGNRAPQFFLLEVQFDLVNLQLVQQLERRCRGQRRRCEFVQHSQCS